MLTCIYVVSLFARDNGSGPLEAGRWGLLAGVGAAPGFFKNRGNNQTVWPRSGLACDVTVPNNTLTCDQLFRVLTTPEDMFQQNACKFPKFNQLFSNGVVHVTGQISYNVCNNTQYFLEGVYERARGNCITLVAKNFRAPTFCNGANINNCSSSTDCSNSGGILTCDIIGTPLTVELPTTASFANYQAYGGYIGARYYCNRVWCNRFTFFGGFKIGMLHRRQVCFTSSVAAHSATLAGDMTVYNFPATSNSYTLFCASNAVSGGLQLGTDFCINDCWSVLVGVEVVATSPFKSNRNLITVRNDPTGTATGFGHNFEQATNFILASTGSFIQFPVWAGIRWEFDFCKRACDEC
jgi:hypothetical protein